MYQSLNQRQHTEKFGCLGFAIVALAVICFSFFRPPNPPKVYSLNFPIEGWGRIMQALDSTNKTILESDIPAKKAVYITGELGMIKNAIQEQIGAQIQAENKKSDSLSKKQK